jgi:hypothetical protein
MPCVWGAASTTTGSATFQKIEWSEPTHIQSIFPWFWEISQKHELPPKKTLPWS